MFITFEGIDGAGKTTQISLLKEYLLSKNIPLIVTREPGGTPVGEKLRDIIKNDDISLDVELLLLYSSRLEHLIKIINPAINEGKVVISDRFDDSTIAYQHYGRGIDLDKIKKIRRLTIGDFQPDLTILLDLDVKDRINRLENRNIDRIESENINFHKKVSEGYRKISSNNRFLVIDASKDPEEIFEILKKEIDRRIK